MSKIYSANEEDFIFDDISDALDCFDEALLDDIVTIYEADLVTSKASNFLPRYMLDEDLNENAFDVCGEVVDEWPDLDSKFENSLQSAISKAVDTWFSDNKMQPNFGIVENTKPLKYKVTDIEDVSNWEIIDE